MYQFYFKQKLEEYAQNAKFKSDLEIALKDLEDTFMKAKPEEVIQLWRGNRQPWLDSVERRTKYFENEAWSYSPPDVTSLWLSPNCTMSPKILR